MSEAERRAEAVIARCMSGLNDWNDQQDLAQEIRLRFVQIGAWSCLKPWSYLTRVARSVRGDWLINSMLRGRVPAQIIDEPTSDFSESLTVRCCVEFIYTPDKRRHGHDRARCPKCGVGRKVNDLRADWLAGLV